MTSIHKVLGLCDNLPLKSYDSCVMVGDCLIGCFDHDGVLHSVTFYVVE